MQYVQPVISWEKIRMSHGLLFWIRFVSNPTNVPWENTIVLLVVSFKRYKTLYMEV